MPFLGPRVGGIKAMKRYKAGENRHSHLLRKNKEVTLRKQRLLGMGFLWGQNICGKMREAVPTER